RKLIGTFIPDSSRNNFKPEQRNSVQAARFEDGLSPPARVVKGLKRCRGIPHPPRFRSTPGLAPVSANETSFLNERKAPADPSIPTAGADVGVPNQSHILDLLYAYYAFQGLAHLESPKRDAGLDFMRQHVPRHVWFCPA